MNRSSRPGRNQFPRAVAIDVELRRAVVELVAATPAYVPFEVAIGQSELAPEATALDVGVAGRTSPTISPSLAVLRVRQSHARVVAALAVVGCVAVAALDSVRLPPNRTIESAVRATAPSSDPPLTESGDSVASPRSLPAGSLALPYAELLSRFETLYAPINLPPGWAVAQVGVTYSTPPTEVMQLFGTAATASSPWSGLVVTINSTYGDSQGPTGTRLRGQAAFVTAATADSLGYALWKEEDRLYSALWQGISDEVALDALETMTLNSESGEVDPASVGLPLIAQQPVDGRNPQIVYSIRPAAELDQRPSASSPAVSVGFIDVATANFQVSMGAPDPPGFHPLTEDMSVVVNFLGEPVPEEWDLATIVQPVDIATFQQLLRIETDTVSGWPTLATMELQGYLLSLHRSVEGAVGLCVREATVLADQPADCGMELAGCRPDGCVDDEQPNDFWHSVSVGGRWLVVAYAPQGRAISRPAPAGADGRRTGGGIDIEMRPLPAEAAPVSGSVGLMVVPDTIDYLLPEWQAMGSPAVRP
jgi:hypothetical protein